MQVESRGKFRKALVYSFSKAAISHETLVTQPSVGPVSTLITYVLVTRLPKPQLF